MMARTCTNNLRVVLSPYVQHCPCEALEQKWGPKPKSNPFDSSRHFSVILVSKLDEKWPSYDHAKHAHQSGTGLF